MSKDEKKAKPADKPTPITSTYYAHKSGAEWLIQRVDVAPDSSLSQETVFRHPAMLVVSERLRVLLERVLP